MTSYFPGWRAVLDDTVELQLYPSTNLGLLTVDLPPGRHDLRVTWAGTGLQRWATILSLLALGGLAWFTWRTLRNRWLAAIPLVLLALGLVALARQAPMVDAQALPQAIEAGGVELLGYRVMQKGDHDLYIYPVLYVRQTPSDDTRVRWLLRDETGRIVSDVVAQPYFNSLQASNWPSGTLVDDAFKLALPPQLAAGRYQLEVQILSSETNGEEQTYPAGELTLDRSIAPQLEPDFPVQAQFGDEVRLAGYDLAINREAVTQAEAPQAVVHPGDVLEYTLYWQALHFLTENYHGFVHLVDLQGSPLAQRDQLAGSFFSAPRVWDTVYWQRDPYGLTIPDDASNGLYWPMVGLYDFDTLDRLPVYDDDGTAVADAYRLPPVKVVGERSSISPEHQVSLRLGEFASLLGYDLDVPEVGLRPGSQFKLTLYFRNDAPTKVDYTRFVHLFDADLGMAAQRDSKPQDGNNPTWSWVPGEVIVDRVTLEVAEDARAGAYTLRVGLYDPSTGTRIPILDEAGTSLPDGQAVLTTLPVTR
jgi:hypothetical protein